jgi:hypothetical protein
MIVEKAHMLIKNSTKKTESKADAITTTAQ